MEIGASRRHWRPRWARYQRLDGSSSTQKRSKRIKIRTVSDKKRRFWRIKLVPKLKILKAAASSPKRLLVWLRDAYVNMMLRMASSSAVTAGYGYGLGGMTLYDGMVGALRGGRPAKEYDEKMLVEIYKSILMARDHQLVRREAAEKVGTEMVCRTR